MKDLKGKISVKLIQLSTFLMTLMALGPIRAFADGDVDWISNGDEDSTLVTLNDKAQLYARSIYKIMMTVGAACAVICGLIAAVKIMSGDPRKRNEGKDTIFWVLVGAALIGGIVSIIGFAMSVGRSF